VVRAYLPDTPVVRADIARHYDNIAFAEQQVRAIIVRLDAEGLREETLAIVTTDHGDGFPRMKRTLYDSGILVPMMVRFPDGHRAGETEQRLVSFVDLAPTILDYAGVAVPDWVQGRTKAVRDARFRYIRNYMPDLAVLRPLAFRDALPTTQEFWRLVRGGGLPPAAQRLVASPRGAEELYDVIADPQEIDNLAGDPAYRDTRRQMRGAMDRWIARTGDMSAVPEAEMIAAMWPGMVQPVTAAPVLATEDGRVVLSSATPGASIAYTLDGTAPEPGRIYTGPFTPPTGAVVTARAVRHGYAPSKVATRRLP